MFEPIVILEKRERCGWFPTLPSGIGELVPISTVNEIIGDLIDYCDIYRSDEVISRHNEKIRNDVFEYINKPTGKSSKNKNLSGYIYIFECAGYYKVGYSKNVEKRLIQLDVRPFKLELVAKYWSDNAYTVEQIVHKKLVDNKKANEWYDVVSVEYIVDIIEKTIKEVDK